MPVNCPIFPKRFLYFTCQNLKIFAVTNSKGNGFNQLDELNLLSEDYSLAVNLPARIHIN